MRTANSARAAVLAGTNVLPATERALLAGFLLGDTRSLPDALVDDFRDAGLSHLLAVSGANVAFVLALAGPLLRRLRLEARFAGGIAKSSTRASGSDQVSPRRKPRAVPVPWPATRFVPHEDRRPGPRVGRAP